MIQYYAYTGPDRSMENAEGLFRIIDQPNYLKAEYVNADGSWTEDNSLLRDASGASAEPGVRKVGEEQARKILESWDFVEDAYKLVSQVPPVIAHTQPATHGNEVLRED